jgi:hypothetical protein
MANYKDLKYIFPASSIASGTFADARIAASNVSQHATSFDDNKIVNDISTLGLRVHTQENLNASNSNSASFDVFQDSSAISNLTNATRNDAEYISSLAQTDTNNVTINESNYQTYFDYANNNRNSFIKHSSGVTDFYNVTASNNMYFNAGATDISSNNEMSDAEQDLVVQAIFEDNSSATRYTFQNDDTSGSSGARVAHHNLGMNTGYSFAPTSAGFRWRNGSGGHGDSQFHGSTSSNNTYEGTFLGTLQSGTISNGSSYSVNFSNSTFYDVFTVRVYHTSENSIMFDKLTMTGTLRALSTSATGSFTGNNITASSSTNKMGAVITYQDNAGTNTLNTDIVLQLSADGGSNFSTATMTALPDFATGIKMAKVNDLSVTAGTSLTYKISFANQASGSKEARIRGVSLQY